MNALHHLADLLDSCEPEDDAPVTWGSLRRQVRAAAERVDQELRERNLRTLDEELNRVPAFCRPRKRGL